MTSELQDLAVFSIKNKYARKKWIDKIKSLSTSDKKFVLEYMKLMYEVFKI